MHKKYQQLLKRKLIKQQDQKRIEGDKWAFLEEATISKAEQNRECKIANTNMKQLNDGRQRRKITKQSNKGKWKISTYL